MRDGGDVPRLSVQAIDQVSRTAAGASTTPSPSLASPAPSSARAAPSVGQLAAPRLPTSCLGKVHQLVAHRRKHSLYSGDLVGHRLMKAST